MGKHLRKIGMILLIVLTMLITSVLEQTPVEVSAASKYIKVDAFIKQLVVSMKLKVDISKSKTPYIDAALSAGIIKKGQFKKYSSYITRGDAAVLLNRADEYLYGDTVDAELVKVILEKRISDITKISSSKREAVAKCFAKGIFAGTSNGYYIQNRSFKGKSYLTSTDASAVIKLLMNPKSRAKVSPDGMLIRTTNLPKNADKYEYILACYPNKFYERPFEFMMYKNWETRSKDKYAFPVDMKNRTFKNWYDSWPLSQEMDKYLYDWVELAEQYLKYVFNVDYRTVDDKWINGLGSLYTKSNINMPNEIKTYFIDKLKTNKVIVESSIIAVEPSTFYDDNNYCIRAYVRYRITAADISVKQNGFIYASYPYLDNLKSGEWREGIFDIRFGINNGSSGDGADFSIDILTKFIDSINTY
ncbi:MAG: S-layer homology domain-containing protein [Mobilitalea sp.]